MRKFIVLIFFLIIISIMLFSNFKHEKKIMIIGYIKNPTTIEYSKEINDEDVIEKLKKNLDDFILNDDKVVPMEYSPNILLTIHEKNNNYVLEVSENEESAILTINKNGNITKNILNSLQVKKILEEIRNLNI